MKYKAVISYKGKNYNGFAKQKNKLTVQDTLEEVLKKVLGYPVKTFGSARTDSGVGAIANVISFETNEAVDIYSFKWGLNAVLPKDIKVSEIQEVAVNFNPKADATSRKYSYYILNRKHPSVFFNDMCHNYAKELDFKAMKKASEFFIGRHKLRSFCSYMQNEKTYTRTIMNLKVEKSSDFFDVNKKDLIKITIEAESFLYNMVRIIVGTLIYVGLNKIKPDDIPNILKSNNRKKAGPTAPAKGLVLVKVKYDK